MRAPPVILAFMKPGMSRTEIAIADETVGTGTTTTTAGTGGTNDGTAAIADP